MFSRASGCSGGPQPTASVRPAATGAGTSARRSAPGRYPAAARRRHDLFDLEVRGGLAAEPLRAAARRPGPELPHAGGRRLLARELLAQLRRDPAQKGESGLFAQQGARARRRSSGRRRRRRSRRRARCGARGRAAPRAAAATVGPRSRASTTRTSGRVEAHGQVDRARALDAVPAIEHRLDGDEQQRGRRPRPTSPAARRPEATGAGPGRARAAACPRLRRGGARAEGRGRR